MTPAGISVKLVKLSSLRPFAQGFFLRKRWNAYAAHRYSTQKHLLAGRPIHSQLLEHPSDNLHVDRISRSSCYNIAWYSHLQINSFHLFSIMAVVVPLSQYLIIVVSTTPVAFPETPRRPLWIARPTPVPRNPLGPLAARGRLVGLPGHGENGWKRGVKWFHSWADPVHHRKSQPFF